MRITKNSTNKQIVGKNMSNAANLAAVNRFKATTQANSKLKDAPQASNPSFLNALQYTTTGEKCASGCRADPSGDFDVCDSEGGTEEQCVKIANVNDMRPFWVESRKKALTEYAAAGAMVEEIMPSFDPKQGAHDHIQEERKRQLKVVEEIKAIKLKIEKIITTLKADADNLDELKVDLAALKQTYKQLKQENSNPPADCTGLVGYEKEAEGDGLNANWYNNITWTGDPIRTVAKEIDQFLIEEAPVGGVSAANFSVEFVGYIVPPRSGAYTFQCDSDDGCEIKIGAGTILNDNCDATDDYLAKPMEVMEEAIAGGTWDKFVAPEGSNDDPKFPRNNKSDPVDLKAGEFAEIKIRAYHSVHNSLQESGHAWIKVQQESDEIKKIIVPTSSLQTKMLEDQLKLQEQDAQELMLDKVAEQDNAFFDNDQYKMKFVPPRFRASLILKTKFSFKLKELRFMTNKNIVLYLGYEAGTNYPLPAEFVKEKSLMMALEKMTDKDKDDLDMGKIVAASDEIVINFSKQSFSEGEVKVPLSFENSMKLMIIVGLQVPPDKTSCAGESIKVSDTNLGLVVKCDAMGTVADNDCDMAFIEANFWKSKGTPALVSQEYNVSLMPMKLVQIPDPASGKWPMNIKIHQNDSDIETLKVTGAENEWTLAEAVETNKVTLEIDKGEAGGYFEVWGVPCENMTKKAKEEKVEEMKKVGKEPQIPSQEADCSLKLDEMVDDSLKLICKAVCGPTDENGNATFAKNEAGDAYLKTSSVCAAAADAFASDPETLKAKKFGVVKVADISDKNNYFIGFDGSLVKKEAKFKKGDLVDVMTDKCFSRGEVTAINGDLVKVNSNNEEVQVDIKQVFPCGFELAEPCGKLSTNEIKIKFCKGGGPLSICKDKLKEWEFFDTGVDISSEQSGGVYTQGWNAKDENRMLVKSKLDESNESTVQENTVAVIDDDIPGEWAIKMINGFQHVIIEFKYMVEDKVGQEKAAKMDEFEIEINIDELKGKIADIGEIFRGDIPKLKVDKEEIRIKRKKGRISMTSIVIIPIPEEDKSASREKIAAAKTDTFIGCPFREDVETVVNCAQHERDIAKVECPGIVERLDFDDAPEVRCLMKCTDKTGTPEPEPSPPAPLPEEETEEEEHKELVSPTLGYQWCMITGQQPDTVFYFESDVKYQVFGRLAHLYQKSYGDQIIDGNWVDITFLEPEDKEEHTQFFYRHNDNMYSMSKNDNCDEGEECELMSLQKMTKEEIKKFKEQKSKAF